jgi:hypothetical protein
MRFVLYFSAILFNFSIFAQSSTVELSLTDKLIANHKLLNKKKLTVIDKNSDSNRINKNKFSVRYNFRNPYLKLNPGESVLIILDDHYSQFYLDGITISHRQNEPKQTWDDAPAYTATHVYSEDMLGDEWRYWGGPGSSAQGGKFVDQGYFEKDNLYEWPKKGHRSVVNNSSSKKLVKIKAIKIVNTGVDDAEVDFVSIRFIPIRPKKEVIQIFSPNSNFGDILTQEGRYYGGGQKYLGKFPNALELNGGNQAEILPEGWEVSFDRLTIDVAEDGLKLNQVDVMCGDTHPDEQRNEDGGWGSKGNASLSIGVYRKLNNQVTWLEQNINIPPEGVVSASELLDSEVLKRGDKIVLEHSGGSKLYIMAIRMGFDL